MYKERKQCDWCGQLNFVTQHEYIDGMTHQSCSNCDDIARMDVRQFNRAELESIERSRKQLSYG